MGGETVVALAALPADDWTLFHALRRPDASGEVIDHVAVGPTGVFVIDTASWAENVQVRRDVLRHNGKLRDRALDPVSAAAEALAGLLEEEVRRIVQPVVCFPREDKIMGWGRRVMVCSTGSVVPMLLSHPALITPAARAAVCERLALEERAASVGPGSRPPTGNAPRHRASDAPARKPGVLARLFG
jgi:hypothetical protein